MELERFRREKDEFFRTHPQSPLTPAQRRTFRGLRYFPSTPNLRLLLPLEEPEDGQEVRMPLTNGGEQVYRRAGVVRFQLEGRPAC